MKKNKLLSHVLLISLCSSGFLARAQNTVLSGQLKGLSGGTVKIFYIKDGVSITDTVRAAQDIFTWKTNLKEPIRIALTASRDNYYFFAEPGRHLKLRGIKDAIQTYVLSGSPMQQDADAFSACTKNIRAQWDSLYSELKNAPIEEKAAIEKKQQDLRKQYASRVEQFVSDHPKSSFSLYLIELEHDYQVIKHLYHKLSAAAKETSVGKKIATRIATLEKSQIGVEMANFTLPDTSGNLMSLNHFRGQYILVDFWASWCMPCRAENPNVLKVYNLYKDKGFTVIGISLDDQAANWKKAIRDDKMPWTQLSDLKGWKNEVAVHFGVQAIPSNLLLDPSGKIVARDLRGEMLENKLKELLD